MRITISLLAAIAALVVAGAAFAQPAAAAPASLPGLSNPRGFHVGEHIRCVAPHGMLGGTLHCEVTGASYHGQLQSRCTGGLHWHGFDLTPKHVHISCTSGSLFHHADYRHAAGAHTLTGQTGLGGFMCTAHGDTLTCSTLHGAFGGAHGFRISPQSYHLF